MEKQMLLKRAGLCLYAIAGLQAVAALWLVRTTLQAGDAFSAFGLRPAEFGVGNFYFPTFPSLCMVIACILTAKDLRQEKPMAWLFAIGIFLVSAIGWAFPASVLGLLSLLDTRIRSEFISKLDIKL